NGQEAYDVVVDAAGAIYLTGAFADTIAFGGPPLHGTGLDVFVAKLDASGDYVWSHGFGDASSHNGEGLTLDGFGNLYCVGEFSGSIDFGGGVLTSAGSNDIFAVRMSTLTGTPNWSQSYGDANAQSGKAIVAGPNGDVTFTGFQWGQANYGGDPLTSAGQGDVFLAHLGREVLAVGSRPGADPFTLASFPNPITRSAKL